MELHIFRRNEFRRHSAVHTELGPVEDKEDFGDNTIDLQPLVRSHVDAFFDFLSKLT